MPPPRRREGFDERALAGDAIPEAIDDTSDRCVIIDEPLVLEGWRTAFFKLRRIEAERLHVSFKLCDSVCLSRSG